MSTDLFVPNPSSFDSDSVTAGYHFVPSRTQPNFLPLIFSGSSFSNTRWRCCIKSWIIHPIGAAISPNGSPASRKPIVAMFSWIMRLVQLFPV